jgi:hypothetical protein
LPLKFSELKARQRKEREAYSENLALRVHRALSWLCKAENEQDDIEHFFGYFVAYQAKELIPVRRYLDTAATYL